MNVVDIAITFECACMGHVLLCLNGCSFPPVGGHNCNQLLGSCRQSVSQVLCWTLLLTLVAMLLRMHIEINVCTYVVN